MHRLVRFCYPAVALISSQRRMQHYVSVVFQPHCFILPELRVHFYDFVFSGGHIDIAINIEIAFSHASRSFNSLYKALFLGETKFKMAQAICYGGNFQFPWSAPLPPLSPSPTPLPLFLLFFICLEWSFVIHSWISSFLTHKNITGSQTFLERHTVCPEQWKIQICNIEPNSQFIVYWRNFLLLWPWRALGHREAVVGPDGWSLHTSKSWSQKGFCWAGLDMKNIF